jgi:adenine-specific DNA-methyltransferase
MLMTTDPGDLVLDPTCGSGTTAYVAEKLGRRWITCDTSRVAVTLAKQRLMTASFDYYELRYPHEGVKGGFIYKTVPHVMLKSIANNPEIDEIHARMYPAVEAALAELNVVLKKHPPAEAFTVTEGVRKGEKVNFTKGSVPQEWEVPFALPEGWAEAVRKPFEAFHAARQAMQKQMDASIAAHADSEVLYDQPEKSRTKMRITGPFTVEAVPFPTVLSLDEAEQPKDADVSIARSGESARQHSWRDELLKTGIRGKGGQMLKFASLETLPGTVCLHALGTLDTGERVVVSFGPEYGALEQRQVEHALREAGELFPLPKMAVFCAFEFDPEAAKDIDTFKGITALKAKMNTDLLTEDLKKARSSNQSFWLMGQPDVELRKRKDGLYEVEVRRMFADQSEEPPDSRLLGDFGMDDLHGESIKQFRNRFSSREQNHPWLLEDDTGLLNKLGGWRTDRATGRSGLTLAGLLMFGKGEAILARLPTRLPREALRRSFGSLDRSSHSRRDVGGQPVPVLPARGPESLDGPRHQSSVSAR